MRRDRGPAPEIQRARDVWRNRGGSRPDFADTPGDGQESVWDYPRPPCIEPDTRLVEVAAAGVPLARTTRAVRVLETASPPTWYLPPDDVELDQLIAAPGSSFCEWKGAASYLALAFDGADSQPIGWLYSDPYPEFEAIRGWISFYPGRVECLVDAEHVRPQPGRFYGGWLTNEIVGPFKGERGSEGW